jgi:hypothetical protein
MLRRALRSTDEITAITMKIAQISDPKSCRSIYVDGGGGGGWSA